MTESKHENKGQVSNWRAYGVLAGAFFVLAFAVNFIQLAQNAGLPSLLTAGGRLLLSCLVLTPIIWRYYREEIADLHQRDWALMAFAGLWLALHFMTIVFSLEHTTVMVNQVLVMTSPLWVGLTEAFVFRIRFRMTLWFGLVLALLGGALIALASFDPTGAMADGVGNAPLGALLALLGALSGTGYIITGRSVRQRVSALPYVWIVYGSAGLVVSAVIWATGTPISGHPTEGYFWVVMLTLFPQLLGHTGLNYALAYIPATLVAISNQSVVVLATIIAFFIFAEIPQPLEILGAAVIIIGVTISIRGQTKKRG